MDVVSGARAYPPDEDWVCGNGHYNKAHRVKCKKCKVQRIGVITSAATTPTRHAYAMETRHPSRDWLIGIAVAAAAVLVIWIGVSAVYSESGDTSSSSPTPVVPSLDMYSYNLGVESADSGNAASMVNAGVDLGPACSEARKIYNNAFRDPDEMVGPAFYQGCLQRLCDVWDDGILPWGNEDYADACRTLGS